MRNVVLDLSAVSSKEALHAALAEAFSFPAYYGKNLDALFDLLTQIDAPTRLFLLNAGQLALFPGSYPEKFLETLADAQRENPLFTVSEI